MDSGHLSIALELSGKDAAYLSDILQAYADSEGVDAATILRHLVHLARDLDLPPKTFASYTRLHDAVTALGRGEAHDGDRAQRKNILIVEDETLLLSLYQDILDQYRIFVMQTLQEVREAIETVPFDLVIMDLSLPDGCGLDLLPTLRERFPKLPILVVSGELTPNRIRTATSSGATLCIPKPFSPIRLQTIIEEHLTPGPPDESP